MLVANKMLAAVSQLASANNEMEGFSMEGNEFQDFSLDTIDFDDLFAGINDVDLLPDLEMDPEILADFSISAGEESDINITSSLSYDKLEEHEEENYSSRKVVASGSASELGSGSGSEEEIVSRRDEGHVKKKANPSSTDSNNNKGRKSSLKNPTGKRKVKVDWTPELHRRFVQAVEQLGVDKAVPSRILELMGIDCLTRHNIASHLQKYRSHRKHLLAREAEAASWSQRRHYGGKRDLNPWIAPTMGFPPVAPMPPPPPPHMIRPFHVWGHPSVDQSLMHMWPKHLSPSPPPPPPHAWAAPPPPPPADPSFWISHHHQHRFPSPPVHGIPPPPPAMYKVEPGLSVPVVPPAGQTVPRPPSDVHPSKESVDAAIGDVLSKPWLSLPLGLKPPSTDSVMMELQRQGISKIPPT